MVKIALVFDADNFVSSQDRVEFHKDRELQVEVIGNVVDAEVWQNINTILTFGILTSFIT